VYEKLTYLGRDVVEYAVMLQEAVASATTAGRLQNEKKRLDGQLNKVKTTDFSPCCFRPLGGKQLLQRMELIGALHLLPEQNKRKDKALAQPGKDRELRAAFAAPAPLLESVRRLSSLKSKDLKYDESLIPLQRAENTGDASKAVALKLKKRDDEIADNSRKKGKKRLRQGIPSMKLAF
jgi:hypothetical protein